MLRQTSFWRGLGFFLLLACSRALSILARAHFLVIRSRLAQVLEVEQKALARAGSQLKFVVHLYGVERAVLGAQAAVHAQVAVEGEGNWSLQRFTGLRVFGALDPEALGRANARAGAAGRTALLLLAAVIDIIDQERQEAELLGFDGADLGVLNGEDALRIRTGAERGLAGFALARHKIAQVDEVRRDKMPEYQP